MNRPARRPKRFAPHPFVFPDLRDTAGLLTASEIVAQAQSPATLSGVYFLIKHGEVIYVGQSINAYDRLSAHLSKEYDAFFVIPVDPDELLVVEARYIAFLKPRLNCRPDGSPRIALAVHSSFR